jgi:hypothetical protein
MRHRIAGLVSTTRVPVPRNRPRPAGGSLPRRERLRSREPSPPQKTEPAAADPVADLPRALKAIGSVVAPASLITALMFYFGVQHANFYFNYFGVNYTVMGLTTQDFLLRSADGLFLPMLILAMAVLLLLWAYRLSSGRMSKRQIRSLQRAMAVIALACGVCCAVLVVAATVDPGTFNRFYGLPGVLLAAGPLFLALASHLQRQESRGRGGASPAWLAVLEWGALFIVVSVGLFWSVTDYSAVVGATRGARTAAKLPAAPAATLYSQERLSLPALTARELICPQPDSTEAAYLYRYENLKLVFASESQYLFLPTGWPDEGGIALVIPRSDSLRLEFVPGGLGQGATC